MSLVVTALLALAAAVAYGGSTAAQHAALSEQPVSPSRSSGSAPRRSWFALLRSPRWLLGMGGDTLGMVLQIAALAVGPVTLVQPIQVLALPISLPIAWALGGARPSRRAFVDCGWMVAGLIAFFVVAGTPTDARPASPSAVLSVTGVVVALGAVVLALTLRAGPVLKAAVYGGVAGGWFGVVAVLIDSCTASWSIHGPSAFAHAGGLVPLAVLVVLGAVSIVLTQVAFRAGPLAAGFPANLAADPVVAVAIGAVLVHESIPLSAWHLVGYAGALAAVVFGAVRLARR